MGIIGGRVDTLGRGVEERGHAVGFGAVQAGYAPGQQLLTGQCTVKPSQTPTLPRGDVPQGPDEGIPGRALFQKTRAMCAVQQIGDRSPQALTARAIPAAIPPFSLPQSTFLRAAARAMATRLRMTAYLTATRYAIQASQFSPRTPRENSPSPSPSSSVPSKYACTSAKPASRRASFSSVSDHMRQ